MKPEERVTSFLNMIVNSSVIFSGATTDAIASALGDGVGAKRAGADARKGTPRKVSVEVRKQVESLLSESRREFEGVVGKMTPAQRKALLEDLGDASYDRAFDAIQKQDFKLPRLTERLSVDDLLGYIALAKNEDPRFEKLMERVHAVKEPRLFSAAGSAAAPAEREEEARAPATKVVPVPPTIGKLPATYLFPPGAETTISLKGAEDLKLKWESILAPGQFCDDFGIMVSQGTSAVKSPYGGMTLSSVNGKITATMKNLEAFPMAVEISTEK